MALNARLTRPPATWSRWRRIHPAHARTSHYRARGDNQHRPITMTDGVSLDRIDAMTSADRMSSFGWRPVAVERAALRRPVAAALVVYLGHQLLVFGTAAALPPMAPAWFPDLGPALVNLLSAAATIAVIGWLRWWTPTALRWRGPDRSWWWLAPVALVPVVFALFGVRGTASELISSAVLFLLLGVNEEVISRGLVQHLLRPLGLPLAAILTGLIFGGFHLLSGLWFGRPLLTTVAQVVSASAFGVCYAALRWYVGTLWPLIFLHGAEDFFNTNAAHPVPAGVHLAVAILFTGYAGWLLVRLPAAEVQAAATAPAGASEADRGPQPTP